MKQVFIIAICCNKSFVVLFITVCTAPSKVQLTMLLAQNFANRLCTVKFQMSVISTFTQSIAIHCEALANTWKATLWLATLLLKNLLKWRYLPPHQNCSQCICVAQQNNIQSTVVGQSMAICLFLHMLESFTVCCFTVLCSMSWSFSSFTA